MHSTQLNSVLQCRLAHNQTFLLPFLDEINCKGLCTKSVIPISDTGSLFSGVLQSSTGLTFIRLFWYWMILKVECRK